MCDMNYSWKTIFKSFFEPEDIIFPSKIISSSLISNTISPAQCACFCLKIHRTLILRHKPNTALRQHHPKAVFIDSKKLTDLLIRLLGAVGTSIIGRKHRTIGLIQRSSFYFFLFSSSKEIKINYLNL